MERSNLNKEKCPYHRKYGCPTIGVGIAESFLNSLISLAFLGEDYDNMSIVIPGWKSFWLEDYPTDMLPIVPKLNDFFL